MSTLLLTCSCVQCKRQITTQSLTSHINTHTPKSYCIQCNTPIYARTVRKFCSNSCAASFNNKVRPPKTQETKNKTSASMRVFVSSKPKLYNNRAPCKKSHGRPVYTKEYDGNRDAYISSRYGVEIMRISHKEYINKIKLEEINQLLERGKGFEPSSSASSISCVQGIEEG